MFTISDSWSYYCPKVQRLYERGQVYWEGAARVLLLTSWIEHILGRKWEDRCPRARGLCRWQPPEGSLPCRKHIRHSVRLRSCSVTGCPQYFCWAPAAYVLAKAKTQKPKYSRQWARGSCSEKPSYQWPHSHSSPTVFAWKVLRYREELRVWCLKSKGPGVWPGINCSVSQLLFL